MSMKVISNSYLYKTADYGKNIFDYLMSSDRVDKNSNSFSDIVYDVKRQATNSILVKVLLSNKVVLLINKKGGISRAFKVIRAVDVKDKKRIKKVFIDCTDVIIYENGSYRCKKPTVLISYLITAMTYIIYHDNPNAILTNNTVIKNSTGAFVDMMLYVFGYLKVPVTYLDNKERMSFVLAEYFQTCVIGIGSDHESIYNVAKQISGIKEKKTCDYLHLTFGNIFTDGGTDINKFLIKFAEFFMDQKEGSDNKNKLTIEAFSQRWMYAYGPGTFLGLECFVPFAQILTDCYNGAYLNQQNTIEKIVGSKVVVNFTNELFRIGSGN